MALEIEDGTGKATANAYLSVADADAYHAARVTTSWLTSSAAKKEAAILEATAYLDGTYEWVGVIAFSTQALGWPRVSTYDHEGRLIPSNIVPSRVKNATAMLAAQALGGALQPSTSAAAATAGALKRKKVGPLELEFFEGGGSTTLARKFPEANALLRGLYLGSSGGISGTVVRWS